MFFYNYNFDKKIKKNKRGKCTNKKKALNDPKSVA